MMSEEDYDELTRESIQEQIDPEHNNSCGVLLNADTIGSIEDYIDKFSIIRENFKMIEKKKVKDAIQERLNHEKI